MLITDYTLCVQDSYSELEEEVRGAIEEGWQPLGGVSVSLSESDSYKYIVYAQAMVKYVQEGFTDRDREIAHLIQGKIKQYE